MEIVQEQIVCQSHFTGSKRKKLFNLVSIVFCYKSNANDRLCLDELIRKGIELASKVNPSAANDANLQRSKNRIRNNCIAGVLAEFAWRYFLNVDKEIVSETTFESANSQIDLTIISNSKNIEVRSSFPRNGIEFAICHPAHQFDIIGPYVNDYKPNEIQKDFYVRILFPFNSSLIVERIKLDGFAIYLIGGATWAMMADDKTAIIKNFIPEDEINPARLNIRSSFRVVPFSRSLDTLEISELIKNK